jgi:hypothetical protein
MFFFCTEGKEAEECKRDELGYRRLVNADAGAAWRSLCLTFPWQSDSVGRYIGFFSLRLPPLRNSRGRTGHEQTLARGGFRMRWKQASDTQRTRGPSESAVEEDS